MPGSSYLPEKPNSISPVPDLKHQFLPRSPGSQGLVLSIKVTDTFPLLRVDVNYNLWSFSHRHQGKRKKKSQNASSSSLLYLSLKHDIKGSLLGRANLVTTWLLISTLCLMFEHKEAFIPQFTLQRNARCPRKISSHFTMVFLNPLKKIRPSNCKIQQLLQFLMHIPWALWILWVSIF